MDMKKKIIVLIAMAVLAFATTQGVFAQDTTETDDLDNEVTALNQAATEDPTALLAKLSVEFSVDLVVLQDLYTQGYTPGQIWLALEISKASTTTLQDAILVAGSTEGHGWGVLAQTMGIAPGSADFHALKLKWGEHQGQLLREMNQEREQNGNGNGNENGGKGKGGTENGNGGGNKGLGKK